MDGIMYVVNQLGLALSQANARIAELENALRTERAASNPSEGPRPEQQ